MAATGRTLWSDTLPPGEHRSFAPLGGDGEADVVIVGAGLTGLWTAHALLAIDPAMRIVIVEREHVGFGASGRNGGWLSALLPMSLPSIAARHGGARAARMQRAMHAGVEQVLDFVASQGVPDIAHRGGTIQHARTTPQLDRLRAHLDEYRSFGFGDDDYRWLGPDEAGAACRAAGSLGALFTPHCATVHPLRLTHAVAAACTSAGATIHEHTTVDRIEPGRVVTDRGTVRADVVVRATEGYTPLLDGQRRAVLPIYSMMIASEPLGEEAWERVGLTDRPTFSDARRMVIYGQRTADGRIAFGGRGAPYHFGSRIRPEFDTDRQVRDLLIRTLHELFPQIADELAAPHITHHWGGVLAAPRDWTCGVVFDRATGLAAAGGYVGDGVTTTNLAGRTLAALITGSDDDADRELVRLPWVGHRSRRWEPEPLRWIGVNAARLAARRADAHEEGTDRPSKMWGGLFDTVLGGD